MSRKDQNIKEFDNKLLVEGKDDQHIIWTLCRKFRIQETFNVVDLEGIDNLIEDLSVRPRQADITCLGIVVDADSDISKRWNQLKKVLSRSGYRLPSKPDATGTIIAADDLPRVGIWLMPNNQAAGMLEDFVRLLVPEGDERLVLAEKTLATLEGRHWQRYAPNHHSKALIHTWLAWQESSGAPLGQAVTKKYLTTDTDLCQRFTQWLNQLFNA